MSNPNQKATVRKPPAPTSEDAPSDVELSAEDAAALVQRVVPQLPDEEGNARPDKRVALRADEVLAYKVYEDGRVVVVTVDGQKFGGELK
jgi:hypothetical protein